MRQVPYREVVGALMWAEAMTRPDMSFAAHQLAKFTENLAPAHWKAAKKALQYLWRTKDMRIPTERNREETPSYRHGSTRTTASRHALLRLGGGVLNNLPCHSQV